MENLSLFTHFLIVISTVFVVYQLYKATHNSIWVLSLIVLWAVIIAVLGLSGFYRQGYGMPPRFIFLVGPGIGLILYLFLSVRGRKWIDSVKISHLTLIQSVRFPVEIVLYHLYIAALVPQIMTFEGSNFDILTGLSAPLVYFLVFRKKILGARTLLLWNVVCLVLLFTIMTVAILSLATPFQQFGLEQPNVGVTYFPFVWLPGIIVPAALFSHLVCIRKIYANHFSLSKQKVLGSLYA